jgi:hypothetical protein
MTANDTATRRVTTGIVLAVGLFAGSDVCPLPQSGLWLQQQPDQLGEVPFAVRS